MTSISLVTMETVSWFTLFGTS